MLRPVLRLGAPALRTPAAEVEAITPEITGLVQDMIGTMYAAQGIGLAAPQIGVSLRIFVLDLSVGRDPQGLRVCINPRWVRRDGMLFVDHISTLKRGMILRKLAKAKKSRALAAAQ